MPSPLLVSSVWRAFALLSVIAVGVSAAPDASSVAVVRTAEWAPGDATRDGAGEFLVLLRAAQVQRKTSAAGLVAVGDRDGMLRSGGERGLRRAALTGVVVAKLAPQGAVAPTPDDLFIDAGKLPAEHAGRVLAHGLDLFGASPRSVNPDQPTPTELAAIRLHLRKFQALFTLEGGARVAVQ